MPEALGPTPLPQADKESPASQSDSRLEAQELERGSALGGLEEP